MNRGRRQPRVRATVAGFPVATRAVSSLHSGLAVSRCRAASSGYGELAANPRPRSASSHRTLEKPRRAGLAHTTTGNTLREQARKRNDRSYTASTQRAIRNNGVVARALRSSKAAWPASTASGAGAAPAGAVVYFDPAPSCPTRARIVSSPRLKARVQGHLSNTSLRRAPAATRSTRLVARIRKRVHRSRAKS